MAKQFLALITLLTEDTGPSQLPAFSLGGPPGASQLPVHPGGHPEHPIYNPPGTPTHPIAPTPPGASQLPVEPGGHPSQLPAEPGGAPSHPVAPGPQPR